MGTQSSTSPSSRDGAVRHQPTLVSRTTRRPVSRLSRGRALPGLIRLLLALLVAVPAGLLTEGARPALAAAGDLDPTFGSGGRVVTDFADDRFGVAAERARAMVVQPDGKLVVAGSLQD